MPAKVNGHILSDETGQEILKTLGEQNTLLQNQIVAQVEVQKAIESANTAIQKAAEASNSQNAAKSSEIAAKASQNAAQASEIASKNSETASKTSEKNAKESEELAVKIADEIYPEIENEGSILQFDNILEGYPLKVKSFIKPVQEGEGDPSPKNVRPIHGVTELKLVNCRKNLITMPYVSKAETINGILYTVNDDGSIKIKGKSTAKSVFYLARFGWHGPKSDNLMISAGNGSWSYDTVTLEAASVSKLDYDAHTDTWDSISNGENTKKLTPGRWIHSVYIMVQAGITVDTTVFPQLTSVNHDTSYESYHGDIYIQPLPGEIMGGIYNWATGNLMVTKKRTAPKAFKKGFTLPSITNKMRVYATVPGQVKRNSVPVSTLFKSVDKIAYNTAETGNLVTKGDTGKYLEMSVNISEFPTVSKWNAYVAAHSELYFVYELDTPEFIQLPKHLILSQPGITTVYGNTFKTKVTARKDLNALTNDLQSQIDKLKKAIVATGGNL